MKYLALSFYYLIRFQALGSKLIWKWVFGHMIKSRANSCGSISIYGRGRFAGIRNLNAGNNIHVNFGAHWMCEGGLTVEDNVHFGMNSTIYTHNHNYHGSALPYDSQNISRPVHIHKNVWIGANVTIVPGTRIGEGAIIGAGSTVHGTIPAFSIMGAPAPLKLGKRDEDHYRNLDSNSQFGGPGGQLFNSKKVGDLNARE